MIKSKEEYYSILERLRTLNFNQKLGRNLQAKLEAFEEMEELVNLTIPVVVGSTEWIEEIHEKTKKIMEKPKGEKVNLQHYLQRATDKISCVLKPKTKQKWTNINYKTFGKRTYVNLMT